MVTLVPGKVVRSRSARLVVENRLTPGRHQFRLSVIDASGNESAPADLIVEVRETIRPVPPVRPRPPVRRVDPAGGTVQPIVRPRGPR